MGLDLASIIIAFKNQSAKGTPASGSGGLGLELLPSQGFSSQVAEIASGLINRSRMADRSRQGSEFHTFAGDTELIAGASTGPIATIFANVLGGTWQPAQTLTESDLTSCAISGTGTVITFGGGNVITEGLRVGMTAKLANMATSGNNGKYFPILGISDNGRVLTIPSGILTDETADTAFSLIVSAALYTDSPFTKRYSTMEAYLPDPIDQSLVGLDAVFNGLSVAVAADAKIKLGLKLGVRDLDMKDVGLSPVFTTPTFETGESLVMLDGGVFFNGTQRVNLTSFNLALEASASGKPGISRKKSSDVSLGQFKFTGQFTGDVDDVEDYNSWRAEDRVSAYLHCAEQNADSPYTVPYVGIYAGNTSFGNWSMPIAGDGPAEQTVTMNGGRDKRGGVHALSTLVISLPT